MSVKPFKGMDLIAVISTGEDVWELRVKGQLENETWSNIGVRWEPHNLSAGLAHEDRGGLELYVNSEKVGHAILPIERPGVDPVTDHPGSWSSASVLKPLAATWNPDIKAQPPIMMLGCHRNSDDLEFKHFRGRTVTFDELSIWTRKLEVNRTTDETLYFTAGYSKILIKECAKDVLQSTFFFVFQFPCLKVSVLRNGSR